MDKCIKDFLKENGECTSQLSDVYLMNQLNSKVYDDCTLTQVKFYTEHCIDTNNPCNTYNNIKLFAKTRKTTEDFMICLFEHEISLADTLCYFGALCTENKELEEKYLEMKQHVINQDCPKELSAYLTDYELKYSKGTYCKQFTDTYEEYCL